MLKPYERPLDAADAPVRRYNRFQGHYGNGLCQRGKRKKSRWHETMGKILLVGTSNPALIAGYKWNLLRIPCYILVPLCPLLYGD
jgi:hypothetical protein